MDFQNSGQRQIRFQNSARSQSENTQDQAEFLMCRVCIFQISHLVRPPNLEVIKADRVVPRANSDQPARKAAIRCDYHHRRSPSYPLASCVRATHLLLRSLSTVRAAVAMHAEAHRPRPIEAFQLLRCHQWRLVWEILPVRSGREAQLTLLC